MGLNVKPVVSLFVPKSAAYAASPGVPTTLLLVEGEMSLTPLFLPSWRYDALGINVSTAGAAGALLRLGIYANDVAGFAASALVIDAGTADASSTGNKIITFTALALSGWVWLATVSQGAPATASTVRAVTSVGGFTFNSVPTTHIAPSVKQLAVTGALPATATGTTSQITSIPRIAPRFA